MQNKDRTFFSCKPCSSCQTLQEKKAPEEEKNTLKSEKEAVEKEKARLQEQLRIQHCSVLCQQIAVALSRAGLFTEQQVRHTVTL